MGLLRGTESRFACDRCFQDERLREFIREYGQKGRCAWCGSRIGFRIPLTRLGPIFREAASIYQEVSFDEGDSISLLLQEDWSVFSDKIAEAPDGRMDDLCIAILEAGLHPKDDVDEPDYRGFFRRERSSLGEIWSSQLEAMLTEKPSRSMAAALPVNDEVDGGFATVPDPDPVEVALATLSDLDPVEFAYEELSRLYEEGATFFRARVHKDRSRYERFTLAELGAPPPSKAEAGRANRKGEPVLYLASDSDTALAEVRAWKGAAVAVATMRLRKQVRVIDLLRHKTPDSPFFDELLGWKLQLADLFHRLAEELSRPIMPHESDSLYLPTQHLCDLIRRAGYDGVAYPSAMGPGSNIVLFDPAAAEAIKVRYVRVGLVRFDYEDIPTTHDLYEEGAFDHLVVKTKAG